MTRDKLIVKISGRKIFREDASVDTDYIREFSESIRAMTPQYHVGIVPGGGPLARKIIDGGKRMGMNSASCDMLARGVLRLSCDILIASMSDFAYHVPIDDIDASRYAFQNGSVPVMTGNFPGQSSDNMAVQYAGANNVRTLVKLTECGGVYDKDPYKCTDAKLLPEMSHDELIEIARQDDRTSGNCTIFDALGARGLKNNSITLYVVGPEYVNRLHEILTGQLNPGTIVRPKK